jgi:hypothetical protein
MEGDPSPQIMTPDQQLHKEENSRAFADRLGLFRFPVMK